MRPPRMACTVALLCVLRPLLRRPWLSSASPPRAPPPPPVAEPAKCPLPAPCRRPDPTRSLTLNMDVQAGSVTVHKAASPDLPGGIGSVALRATDGRPSRLHRAGGSGGSGLTAFGTSAGASPVGSVLLGAAVAAASSAPGSPREGGGGGTAVGGHVSWADEVVDSQMASLLESTLLDVRGLGPACFACLPAQLSDPSCSGKVFSQHSRDASRQPHGAVRPLLSMHGVAVPPSPAGPRCPGAAPPRAAAHRHCRHGGSHPGCAYPGWQHRHWRRRCGRSAGGGAGPAGQQVPGAGPHAAGSGIQVPRPRMHVRMTCSSLP